MKKQLLLLAMILLPLVTSADTVEIDGICYNLITKGNAAEVKSNLQKYKGNTLDYARKSCFLRYFIRCF